MRFTKTKNPKKLHAPPFDFLTINITFSPQTVLYRWGENLMFMLTGQTRKIRFRTVDSNKKKWIENIRITMNDCYESLENSVKRLHWIGFVHDLKSQFLNARVLLLIYIFFFVLIAFTFIYWRSAARPYGSSRRNAWDWSYSNAQ